MVEEIFIVHIPSIGTLYDQNSCVVNEELQKYLIRRARESWKRCIECEVVLKTKLMPKDDEHDTPWMNVYYDDNPYFGWSFGQLKIVIDERK